MNAVKLKIQLELISQTLRESENSKHLILNLRNRDYRISAYPEIIKEYVSEVVDRKITEDEIINLFHEQDPNFSHERLLVQIIGKNQGKTEEVFLIHAREEKE